MYHCINVTIIIINIMNAVDDGENSCCMCCMLEVYCCFWMLFLFTMNEPVMIVLPGAGVVVYQPVESTLLFDAACVVVVVGSALSLSPTISLKIIMRFIVVLVLVSFGLGLLARQWHNGSFLKMSCSHACYSCHQHGCCHGGLAHSFSLLMYAFHFFGSLLLFMQKEDSHLFAPLASIGFQIVGLQSFRDAIDYIQIIRPVNDFNCR